MLKSLTSLRFFAMLMVYFSHLRFMKNVPKYAEVFDSFFSDGAIGVTFFLLLSGFVISYNYLDKFKVINKNYSKIFMIKRISRIYPLHIITLLISLPLMWEYLFDPSIIVKILINGLLLQSLTFGRCIEVFNAVSWTLSCLAVFYILTPAILYLINKIINKYTLSSLYYIIALIYVSGFIAINLFFVDNSATSEWFFYKSPFFRIIDYIIGIMTGVIFKYKKECAKDKNMDLYEAAAVIIYILFYMFHTKASFELRLGVYYIPATTLVIFIFAFQKGFISKILSSKYFLKLGDISFSFYLIHYLVIRYVNLILEEALKVQWSGNVVMFEIVFTFVVSIILSILSYKYIENPLKDKIRVKIDSSKVLA